ncbi:hypothetical protein TRVL_00077 [Trypanosoma vivax]|uniref:Palmitoyltransferase n=1 Tax=Trypanosoma vivax (strain Y486) TaxID=1055687 RepID=G0TTS2_TRYVY|nr:hypothetical protein TRVL_00077 [Trypanosoma vivax]CCC47353.1 conserved hypothetical protein [Trypanosoma vivax Y486]
MARREAQSFNGRVLLCGRFNVARGYHSGVAILVAIPVLCIVCVYFFASSSEIYKCFAESHVRLCAYMVAALTFLTELTMMGVFLCDPGFTNDADAVDTHLCPLCRLCVRGYDHHCDILGSCIGRRNMCFFILFLTSLCLLSWVNAVLAYHSLISVVHGGRGRCSIRDVFGALIDKDWMLASWRRPVTVVVVWATFYATAAATALCTLYWHFLFGGKYSLHRRRSGVSEADSLWFIFRQLWRAELTPVDMIPAPFEFDAQVFSVGELGQACTTIPINRNGGDAHKVVHASASM